MPVKTIIEPFRIKSVEPIRWTTREHRQKLLAAAHYNLFLLHADDVLIDLLTDSGTGAMSTHQWAAIMEGDESYAGSRSFDRFRNSIQDICGYKHVIPTHQGRAAERILFSVACKKGDIVPNNTHFDTTRANMEFVGAEAVDLLIPEGRQPALQHPFKGNMDVEALEALIAARRSRAHSAGHAYRHQQLRRRPAGLHGKRAPGQRGLQSSWHPALLRRLPLRRKCLVHQAARKGTTSTKLQSKSRRRCFAMATAAPCRPRKTAWPTSAVSSAPTTICWPSRRRISSSSPKAIRPTAALAGRDLEAIAVGMQEALEEDYLRYRIASTAYLGNHIAAEGVPIVQPPGGHAIYLDARAFLPHIPADQFPGVALAAELYLEGGIRSVEIGTLMFAARSANGSGPPGHSPPRLHPEPHRLPCRGDPRGMEKTRQRSRACA